MKKYEVFHHDGGYRIVLDFFLGKPRLSACPWYRSRALASQAAREYQKAAEITASFTDAEIENIDQALMEDNYAT